VLDSAVLDHVDRVRHRLRDALPLADRVDPGRWGDRSILPAEYARRGERMEKSTITRVDRPHADGASTTRSEPTSRARAGVVERKKEGTGANDARAVKKT